MYDERRLLFWVYVFFLSKYYEFLDTVFILLKKNDPGFLHVYHHILTLLNVWLGMRIQMTFQLLAILINSFVHIFMYYYFTRVTLGSVIWWKKYLTTFQITQFFMNLFVLCAWGIYNLLHQSECAGDWPTFFLTVFSNVSFYILFQRFYNRTYQKKSQ
eukprot:TRINITY_DN2685_c0_g1_i3.p1 TRINITY_DN2685_c0_g1~~TRINITY_DN2685_c0_g1_i3.p1  ORF type:complete len:158 (-),score=14.64 TRINITY_DN2685_c0_g1_i3:41-514(-)